MNSGAFSSILLLSASYRASDAKGSIMKQNDIEKTIGESAGRLAESAVERSIVRITYYEEILNRTREIIAEQAQRGKLSRFQELQDCLNELEDYYASPEWKDDFALDESGELPASLRRGVLSEDGLDHALDDGIKLTFDALNELLELPYALIDIFPERVPENRSESYSEAEKRYLDPERLRGIRGKIAEVLIKLGCYFEISVNRSDEPRWTNDPSPDKIASLFADGSEVFEIRVVFPSENALFVMDGCDTYATMYGASERLSELAAKLSASEGLFLWTPDADQ